MGKIIFILLFVCRLSVYAVPSVVCIIRHAEKQKETEVLQDGKERVVYRPDGKPVYTQNLSLKGWERAYALAPYFAKKNESMPYGKPIALFAPSIGEKDPSLRPLQTLTPLSNLLHIDVQQLFAPEQYAQLVQEITTTTEYDGKFVLIAYEHEHIPALAQAFGVTSAPTVWKGDIFDRVWVIHFDQKTKGIVRFENRPQQLMYGDSQK